MNPLKGFAACFKAVKDEAHPCFVCLRADGRLAVILRHHNFLKELQQIAAEGESSITHSSSSCSRFVEKHRLKAPKPSFPLKVGTLMH